MKHTVLACLASGFLFGTSILGMSPASADATNTAGLSSFSDCSELKRYLLDSATQKAWLQSSSMVVAPRQVTDLPVPTPSPMVDGAAPPSVTDGPTDHSDTTVQEVGVDEPDLVKTDGDFIYLLNGGFLLIVDSWPAAEMTELARFQIEGDPTALLIDGDVALVVSSIWSDASIEQELSFVPTSYSLTKLTFVDLSDRSSPKLLRETYLEGSYSTARLVSGRAHLVVTTTLPIYQFTPWRFQGGASPPSTGSWGLADVFDFHLNLYSQNFDDLVPKMEDHRVTSEGVQSTSGSISSCDDFFRPVTRNGSNTLSLLTFDLTAPLSDPRSLTLVSDSGEVYASQDNFYIATYDSEALASFVTPQIQTEGSVIYKFALGAEPQVVASGRVDGWIVNRYAMSDYNGYFRIATTIDMWGSDEGPQNQLYVMAQNEDRLENVATLEGLGHKGERIYAVRYDGDRGYLVTFRQTDPLYTLDLSDPAAPKVAGQLKIPGFSTYLHPIEDGYLLAVGQNTDEGGIDLSLFDVRDPKQPELVDREWLGANSWSEALYEPHAFTYFGPLKQVALPLQQWYSPFISVDEPGADQESDFNGTVVFDVDPTTGLTKRGVVDHSSDTSDPWSWLNNVQRNLYIGDPGDYFLFSLSPANLKASNADSLEDVAQIELPGKESWEWPIIYMEEPVASQ